MHLVGFITKKKIYSLSFTYKLTITLEAENLQTSVKVSNLERGSYFCIAYEHCKTSANMLIGVQSRQWAYCVTECCIRYGYLWNEVFYCLHHQNDSLNTLLYTKHSRFFPLL